MKQIDEGVWDVDLTTQLIYDDSLRGGFYFEKYTRQDKQFRYSKLYPTKQSAVRAWMRGEVVWQVV